MIGDMDQDDQRSLPERAWPGLPASPWTEREHEGGGDIDTGARFQIGRPADHMLSREPGELVTFIRDQRGYVVDSVFAEPEPLEGPNDDPWVQGWHAGFMDGKREAKHRLAMARLDAQHQRRAIVLELTIVVAVIMLVFAIVLST